MMNQVFDNTAKRGTIGGTLLTIFGNINNSDIVKTAILAAIGAVVSFGVTLLLKLLVKKIKK